jgi:hypothetical protein
MLKLKRPYGLALLLLTSALLTSCAASPVVTTVPCPKLPEIPPSLQEPPQSLTALEELVLLLERWQSELSGTPNGLPVAKNSLGPSEIF